MFGVTEIKDGNGKMVKPFAKDACSVPVVAMTVRGPGTAAKSTLI